VLQPLPSPDGIVRLPPDGGAEFNRLIHERSPYLLQHARNPVDWHPWGREAFERARREGKPVFLSIGYSTCHWCHVMERESFEREDVAEILNARYIAIKVDREERPDLDAIYMNATQLLTGRGGWPNSLWLTPDGNPFFAGAYFTREDGPERPGFKTVLRRLAETWTLRREAVEASAREVASALKRFGAMRDAEPAGEPGPELAAPALRALAAAFDDGAGGLAGAPKFPPHAALAFLADACRRTPDESALRMLTRTLDAMAAGGIHDHAGGGFHRYATDARWFLPHFEKMLYDNAQLAGAYVDAYALTGRAEYRSVAEGALDWILRDLRDPLGGFYAAWDADSEGEEGKYYIWTRDDLVRILGPKAGDRFARLFGAVPEGNFEDEGTGRRSGANVLFLPEPPSAVAAREGLDPAAVQAELANGLRALREARDRRVRPQRDDQVLAGWNGLAIGALARAGRILGSPRYLEAAGLAARFILGAMRRDGRLLRRWRAGTAGVSAFLDDYAFLADGLLDLHETTGNPRWLDAAGTLVDTLIAHYRDPRGGFYQTADDHEDLLVRPMTPLDDAVPSGNGVAARALIRLGLLARKPRYIEEARSTLRAFSSFMIRAPLATLTLIRAAALIPNVRPDETSEPPAARVRVGPFDCRAYIPGAPVRPGGLVPVTLKIAIDKGFRVHAARPVVLGLAPASVSLKPVSPGAIENVRWPDGREVRVLYRDCPLSIYEGTVWVTCPIRLAKDVPDGRLTLELTLRVQACGETECLAPTTIDLAVPVSVIAEPGTQ
jgi:uncharacterized protein YyaL (SSP411 family)